MAPEMQPSTHFGLAQWRQFAAESHDVVALDAHAVVDFIARKRRRLHDVLLAHGECCALQATSQRRQFTHHSGIA